jgi:hypothetical protein
MITVKRLSIGCLEARYCICRTEDASSRQEIAPQQS